MPRHLFLAPIDLIIDFAKDKDCTNSKKRRRKLSFGRQNIIFLTQFVCNTKKICKFVNGIRVDYLIHTFKTL